MARTTEARSRKRASSSSAGGAVAGARVTRQRTRTRLTESASNAAMLKDMVDQAAEPMGFLVREEAAMEVKRQDSQEDFDAVPEPVDKGKDKGKARAAQHTPAENEKKEQCFRLMDLPTEIRLEIYRACLTRPYKILLSRVEQQPPPRDKQVGGDLADGVFLDAVNDAVQRSYTLASPGASQSNAQLANSGGTRRVPTISRHAAGRNTLRHIRLATAISSLPAIGAQDQPMGSATVGPSNRPDTNPQPESNTQLTAPPARHNHASPDDPLIINLLRTSKQIYKEARDVLYSENVFDLSIATAVPSLAALHQRSRSHLKHIELEIPTYTEILERFSEIVRLSLRYCKGLKKFVIHTPFALPGADGSMTSSNTTVYANGFDILRWLPQQCDVVLQGTPNVEIDAVVRKHLSLAKAQDEVSDAFAVMRKERRW